MKISEVTRFVCAIQHLQEMVNVEKSQKQIGSGVPVSWKLNYTKFYGIKSTTEHYGKDGEVINGRELMCQLLESLTWSKQGEEVVCVSLLKAQSVDNIVVSSLVYNCHLVPW